MVGNPFLQEQINSNIYFNHLFSNLSTKMYCGPNNNILYPNFQNNLKNEMFNHNNNNINNNGIQEMNEMRQMQMQQKKKSTIEDNMSSQDLFSFNNQQKNMNKNTYMKKINSLIQPNPVDSLKLFQE